MEKNNIPLLTEFNPRSELVTGEHLIAIPKFPVIDIHSHYGAFPVKDSYSYRLNFDAAAESSVLRGYGVRRCVNLGGAWGEGLDEISAHLSKGGDMFINFGLVSTWDIASPDYALKTEKLIRDSYKKGIKGIKLFKSMSLSRDRERCVRPDDARLAAIWDTCAELGLPVLIHIADPVAFFRPADRFNERIEEIGNHPDWAFSDEVFFRFEELMDMQEKMISENPKTTFIIAHVGSYGENLGWVGGCLDKYTNMHIDIAARISELGRQPYTARKFFNKYADRILFGTDASAGWNHMYPTYYRFLETFDEYFNYSVKEVPGQGRWYIYGLGLEDEVLEKVYYKNAEKLLGIKI